MGSIHEKNAKKSRDTAPLSKYIFTNIATFTTEISGLQNLVTHI